MYHIYTLHLLFCTYNTLRALIFFCWDSLLTTIVRIQSLAHRYVIAQLDRPKERINGGMHNGYFLVADTSYYDCTLFRKRMLLVYIRSSQCGSKNPVVVHFFQHYIFLQPGKQIFEAVLYYKMLINSCFNPKNIPGSKFHRLRCGSVTSEQTSLSNFHEYYLVCGLWNSNTKIKRKYLCLLCNNYEAVSW